MLALDDRIARALGDVVSAQVEPGDDRSRQIVVGLVGRGMQASRSPAMHQSEGARLGLSYRYILIDFDSEDLPDEALADVVRAAERHGFAGLNVTHPFKQTVIDCVTDLSPEAEAIGAVNAVVLDGERRTGHNTDVFGFSHSLRAGLSGCAMDTVALFGAGGAGAAVAYALLDHGVRELLVLDPDAVRGADLVGRMMERFAGAVHAATDVEDSLSKADGIVNASPIGMAKYPGVPFPVRLIQQRHWVAEVVYFPVETELVRAAHRVGCRTLTGTGMAVGQAVKSFELFTGLPADWKFMEAQLSAAA